MSTHAAPPEAGQSHHSLLDLPLVPGAFVPGHFAKLPFVKMHGTGNDFVVLDALSHPLPADFDFAQCAQTVCNRHRGIGGDGLLLLETPDETARETGARLRMRMWNPDGSEDMCGNGLRCIARLAHARGHSQPDSIVQTLAGLRRARIEKESDGIEGLVRVSMDAPQLEMKNIPMRVPLDASTFTNASIFTDPSTSFQERAIEYVLPVGDTLIPHVSTLSTGSTHTVIFLDAPPDDATFERLSPLIENHAWFPERTSVMWAQVVNRDTLRLRIWERGAGETLACGTGACAAAVAAQITGRCGEEVTVQSRGGELKIRWNDDKNAADIEMSGPAQIVYEGNFGV